MLLLQWEVDDLGVETEVQRLSDVFQRAYDFDVQNWRIPTVQPTIKLNRKISTWIEDYQNETNLFILYYAGHAKMDEGRQVIWQKLVLYFFIVCNETC